MPSPFPGMDPYLENPRYFPDFHHSFIVYVKEAIQRALPEPYYAKTEERIWIEYPERSAVPDIGVIHSGSVVPAWQNDRVAILEESAVDTESVEVLPGIEERQYAIELYVGKPGSEGRLVCSIELLSPSNKASGSEGRVAYLGKQAELLAREVHLIEIDLLRGGKHATAIPRESLKRPFDYHIAVRDLNFPPTRRYSYPIRLEDPLPRLAVPLLKGEGYITVELQPVFDRCYDTGSYRREIDYARDTPDPPLGEARTTWARDCIERWSSPSAP